MEKEGDDLIYFTSDLHLGHRGIIEMQKCGRNESEFDREL